MKEYREILSQLAAIGFETLSSEQAQVDWIELKYEVKPNICNRINVFVMVMDLINFYSISNLIGFTVIEWTNTLCYINSVSLGCIILV